MPKSNYDYRLPQKICQLKNSSELAYVCLGNFLFAQWGLRRCGRELERFTPGNPSWRRAATDQRRLYKELEIARLALTKLEETKMFK